MNFPPPWQPHTVHNARRSKQASLEGIAESTAYKRPLKKAHTEARSKQNSIEKKEQYSAGRVSESPVHDYEGHSTETNHAWFVGGEIVVVVVGRTTKPLCLHGSSCLRNRRTTSRLGSNGERVLGFGFINGETAFLSPTMRTQTTAETIGALWGFVRVVPCSSPTIPGR